MSSKYIPLDAAVKMAKARGFLCIEDLTVIASPLPALQEEYRIVFDGMPSPDGPRFVEVEDGSGRSIKAGEWRTRADGLCELVIKTGGRANG